MEASYSHWPEFGVLLNVSACIDYVVLYNGVNHTNREKNSGKSDGLSADSELKLTNTFTIFKL